MGILRTDKISGLETPTAVTGSVLFDGSGDYLSLADSNDWNYSTGHFTIEFWYYFNSLPDSNGQYFYSQRVDGGNYNFIYATNTSWIFDSYEGFLQGPKLTFTTTHSLNTWNHFALTRSGNTFRLFVNGVESATQTNSDNLPDLAAVLEIGRWTGGPNYYFNGYISNLRILKGTALYTSNFTPPTHELEKIGDTVLLCCNNPDSAGAEATGKTITVNGNAAASTFSPGLTRDFTFGTQFEGVSRFDTQGYFVPPSGTTEQRGRGRGVVGGAAVPGTGGTGTGSNSIEYITISSLGNSQDFGDLTDDRRGLGACSSSTRGIFGGGYKDSSGYKRNIDFITISSTSNAINFGDLTDDRFGVGAVSNNTRGVFGGGEDSPARHNILDFVTIASLGNATTFGELSSTVSEYATVNSPTRGVFAGGSPLTKQMRFITIATTGSSQSFGELSATTNGNAGVSSPTRGVIAFGQNPGLVNNIEFITIATLGNAQDFGDTTVSRTQMGETSNSVRGVFIGGRTDTPTPAFAENTMDYVTIASTGNALDFGDLIVNRQQSAGCSDSHGGLS